MRIIALLLLTATLSYAGEHAAIFQDASVPADSGLIIRQNIQTIGGDAKIVPYTSNPLWRLKADHDVTGYIDSIRIDTMGKKGFKSLPLPQLETQITQGVRPPDKQKIKVMSLEDLKEDYEPVAAEE